jgi:hypothetical protein
MGVYTQLAQQAVLFKPANTFKTSEFQALNIKLEMHQNPKDSAEEKKLLLN